MYTGLPGAMVAGAEQLERRSVKRLALVVIGTALLLLSACGGSSPSSPGEQPPTDLTYAENPLVLIAGSPMQPDDPSHQGGAAMSSYQISQGAADAVLKRAAQNMIAFGKPVFIRYLWEFNLQQKGLLTHSACKVDPASPNSAARDFILAWRHMWTVVHEQGVRNVIWLWNPSGFPATNSDQGAAQFYPGDAHVDWVASDHYDRTDPGTPFQTPWSPIYGDANSGLAQYGKSIMIGETGATPSPDYQATYLADATAA